MTKRNYLNVKFKSIDELFEFLPEEELKIVGFTRKLIFECFPHCEEHMACSVPYYKLKKNICFVWPPSVKWGNSRQDAVRLGFTKGYLLSNENNYLEKGERKQVYWKDYNSIKEIDVVIVKSLLYEAALVDASKV